MCIYIHKYHHHTYDHHPSSSTSLAILAQVALWILRLARLRDFVFGRDGRCVVASAHPRHAGDLRRAAGSRALLVSGARASEALQLDIDRRASRRHQRHRSPRVLFPVRIFGVLFVELDIGGRAAAPGHLHEGEAWTCRRDSLAW